MPGFPKFPKYLSVLKTAAYSHLKEDSDSCSSPIYLPLVLDLLASQLHPFSTICMNLFNAVFPYIGDSC